MTGAEEAGQTTGTKDKLYNLIWFTEARLSNALRLGTYIQDAERDGDSELIARRTTAARSSTSTHLPPTPRRPPASTGGAAGLALLAAVTLDGVPENVALGVSIGEGSGGLALLAAIFVSNFPEALVGSASMREQGRTQTFILGVWLVCATLLTAAGVIGAGPLSNADPQTLSLPLAFAAGAVLASLADTLMPEAYEQGGPAVAEHRRRVRPLLLPRHPGTEPHTVDGHETGRHRP